MKVLSALVVLLMSSHAAMALDCQAKFIVIDSNNSVEKSVDLKKTYQSKDMEKYTADLEGDFYSINLDKETGAYTLGIYEGPEYTKGSMTYGKLSDGQIRLSSVNKKIVKKVTCQ